MKRLGCTMLVTLLLLALCSGSVMAESKTTLTYLDPIPTVERTAMLNELIAQFNEQNPDIQVEYQSTTWDEAYKKIVSMGASGTLSDILAVDEGIMKTLAAAEFIVPLDDYVAAFPYADGLSATFQSSINNFSYDGNMYMFPDSFGCQGIFVRADWLTELGYKVEDLSAWTWDEYFEVIQKMTGDGRYGIAFRGGANGIRMYFEYLCSMLEVGGAFPEGTSKSVFESPEAITCLENFYGLYINGYAPKESITWGFQEMVEGFVSGLCGTLNQTPEVVLTTSASMEDVWTVLPSPRNPDAEKNYINWGSTAGFALANGENQDAAWKFVEFMVKPENNLTYCKGFGYLPIYTEQLQDEYFQTGVMKGYADTLADPKSALILTNDLTQWGYFLSEFGTAEVQKYMSGEQTAEQTCANLAAWCTEQWEEEHA